MTARLTFNGKYFILRTTFEMRHVAKENHFKWHPTAKLWYSDNLANASRLRQYADVKADTEIKKHQVVNEPWSGSIPFPEGLTPYPFQLKETERALNHNHYYLALDPGLGKTICAALYQNALKLPMVYVCPPFMCANVEAELKKWGFEKTFARVGRDELRGNPRVVIVPDSILSREETILALQEWMSRGPCILIADEAHRYKNAKAKRTKTFFKEIAPFANRILFLSGTPLVNGRPMELYPVLSNCATNVIGYRNFFEFGTYFCDGFEGPWGWDFTGVSNFPEFLGNVKKMFMSSVKKHEVLPELPDKVERMVFIDDKIPSKLEKLERSILKDHKTDQVSSVIGDEHISTYRKDLGLEKSKAAAKYVKELLDDTDESILLFAIHREAIKSLTENLAEYEPLVITGDVDKDERFRRAEKFQGISGPRLMILNIQAGGVGFTLTKATRVVFSEFSWVEGENSQAADRAHRIGQKNSVLVDYLLYRDSLDAYVLDKTLNKKTITKQI